MEEPLCVRDTSASPPVSLVAPVAVKPNTITQQTPIHLMTQAAAMAVAEQHRLQQLYQLALAERLRIASLSWSRPNYETASTDFPAGVLNGSSAIIAAAAGQNYLYPWRFVDPRSLYRVPEEPKPQHSYIGLIAIAILSSPENKLVLSDIYNYILENYAYFRNRGPGWRNSIRHNLSLNDCFIKSGRSANGKGHYWAIHPANFDDFSRGDFRRRRAQRRVRKHLGLQVEDDSSPEPPPVSPSPITRPDPIPPPHFNLTPTNLLSPSPCRFVQQTKKRQFDVASLLAPDEISDHESLLKARRFRPDLNLPGLREKLSFEIETSTSSSINNSNSSISNFNNSLRIKKEFTENSEPPIATETSTRPWPPIGWSLPNTWNILTPPQDRESNLGSSKPVSPSD